MRQQIATYHSQRRRPCEISYLLHLPAGYDGADDVKWPLILFLHGAGERGDDPELLTRTALPAVLEQRDDLPFVVVSPQCAAGSWWQRYIHRLGDLLDDVVGRLAIDRQRIHVTGVSMGGYATWHLGACYPGRFAALAPVCGFALRTHGFLDRVCALRDVPVWAFHGELDEIVPLQAGRVLVERLRACGGDARLTVYPGVGHDAWTPTYDDPELYRWFLSRVKPQDDAPPPRRRSSRR